MIDVNENNTLCAYAHGGICMSTDGNNKPCCSMFVRGESPPSWSEDHMQTDWWKSLQHNLSNGIKDEKCNKCWDLEKVGNKSMRLSSNQYLQNDQMTLHPWSYVDLKLGSKCNLMCVMCDGSASSLIAKEMWDNQEETWLVKNEADHLQPRGYNRGRLKQWYQQAGYTKELQWWQDPKFYDKLKDNAEHIRTLKFTGGEPTLIPQVMEVIDYMLETGHSEHIKIVITTNGTYKGTGIYEKMCMFREANVNLSVDGTGSVYNYIRYPHTWKQWTRNTKRMLDYKEKINISYQHTTSVFNLFNVREMEDWITSDGDYTGAITNKVNYHPNYVFHPKMMNIRYLPEDTLERAVDYLNGGKKISEALIKFIWESPEISDENKELYQSMLKSDTELKDRLRTKRPNWDSIDSNMLRLKDLFHGR